MHLCNTNIYTHLSVLELDAHGVALVLKGLDLRADVTKVILKLTQHTFHLLQMGGGVGCVCGEGGSNRDIVFTALVCNSIDH